MQRNRKDKYDLAVVGLSHLGLATTISWSSLGLKVLGVDHDLTTTEEIKKGIFKVFEPGLKQLFKRSKNYGHFTSDFNNLKKIHIAFIALDTPLDEREPKKLTQLIIKVASFLKDDSILVIMSQVPVGYCRRIKKLIENKFPKVRFKLYYWVNTIIVGEAINRLIRPERIIIGHANKPDVSIELKNHLNRFGCPVLNMSYESAELTKAAVNLFLASSITTANTLSDLCEISGANVNEIIPALKLDKRIGQYAYLKPTIRIAGGHLERELFRLKKIAKDNKISSSFVDNMIILNESRYLWVIKLFKRYFPKKNEKPTICIWGLSYKKETESTYNAASIEIIKKLRKKAFLNVYDPSAELPVKLIGYKRYKDKYSALNKADVLLILTEWDEFGKASPTKLRDLMRNHLIIDAVGILYDQKKNLEDFTYIAMGIKITE